MGSGNLRLAVALPEGEDWNEWIACNIYDFYKQVKKMRKIKFFKFLKEDRLKTLLKCNMLFGAVLPYCTASKCPVMNAGAKYTYNWQENNGQTVQLSAPQYVDR